MIKALRIFSSICLALASVFGLINTIVEKNIFDAWIIISLYFVSCVGFLIVLFISKKKKKEKLEIEWVIMKNKIGIMIYL